MKTGRWLLALMLVGASVSSLNCGTSNGGGGNTNTVDCAAVCNRLSGQTGCMNAHITRCMTSCAANATATPPACTAQLNAVLSCTATAIPTCTGTDSYSFPTCITPALAALSCVQANQDAGARDVPTIAMDVPSPTDSGPPPVDAVTPVDRSPPPVDRVTPPTDTGPSMMYGECGMTTVDCLCAAGMSQTAQTACFNANMDCGQCFSDAIGTCCPAQIDAYQACAMRNMCMDAACVMRFCGSENTAINTCFQTAQMSNPTCQRALSGCFGSFPLMCGG